MARLTRRAKAIAEQVERHRIYTADEAFELINRLPKAGFVETVEVSVNLGVDPRKSDQVVRGSTVLPHGTGRSVRVAVFAQGANADAAREAGADLVGMEDLAERVKAGQLDFDVVIASPDTMGVVGRLGTILGPRGLMPNPKVGTVTPNVAEAVRNAKAGQVRYRTDKGGSIHCAIGKVGFDPAQLRENLGALMADLNKAKPSTSKGVYIRKVVVATTMGPGLMVDAATIAAAAN